MHVKHGLLSATLQLFGAYRNSCCRPLISRSIYINMLGAFDLCLLKPDDLVVDDPNSPIHVVPIEIWRTVFSTASPSSFSSLAQVCWLWKRAIYSFEFLSRQRERIEEDFNLLLLGPPSPSWIIFPDTLRLKTAWSDSITVHINMAKPTPKTQAFLDLIQKKAWQHTASSFFIFCNHEGIYYQFEIEVTSCHWQRGAANVFLVEEVEELVGNASFNEIAFRPHPPLCDSRTSTFDPCVLKLANHSGSFATHDLQVGSKEWSFNTTRGIYPHGQSMPLLCFPASDLTSNSIENSQNLHSFFSYLLSRQYLLQGKLSPELKDSYRQRLMQRQSGWSKAAWQIFEALVGGVLLCPLLVTWWTFCSWYQILIGQLPLLQKPMALIVVPTTTAILLLLSAPFVCYNHVHDYGPGEALRNLLLRVPGPEDTLEPIWGY